MVSSALLNFIIFIKLIYTSQCGHLMKTFPRALCRLLNEAGAAGRRFTASWVRRGGGAGAAPDRCGVPAPPQSRAVGDAHWAFRPCPCHRALLGKEGVPGTAVAKVLAVNCVSD